MSDAGAGGSAAKYVLYFSLSTFPDVVLVSIASSVLYPGYVVFQPLDPRASSQVSRSNLNSYLMVVVIQAARPRVYFGELRELGVPKVSLI